MHRGELNNNLLRRLSAQDFDLIRDHLRPFHSTHNQPLYTAGQTVETVYFPSGTTLVSFVVSIDSGEMIETMMVGREGAVGGIVSQGSLPAYCYIMVQNQGDFLTLPVAVLEAAKLQSRSLDGIFARYADCLLAQIFQATACNAVHSIEQRTAKWILAALERADSNRVPLTQERLAAMLGVGRSYVSRVVKLLKSGGVLSVRRGRIDVHDVEALRSHACSCNESVKSHYEAVLGGVYSHEEKIPHNGNGARPMHGTTLR
jgi:CRP-like cAMP-binding protein